MHSDIGVQAILTRFRQHYPEAKTTLDYQSPFQLLLAVILSAQTTDKQVNRVTASLFRKYQTPADFAALSEEALAEEIKGCGLYRNKARNIVATSVILLAQFGGDVPRTMPELLQLPGVGRKTANVVLSNAFNIPALAVDTHVFRVANRLGLAQAKNPEETEAHLRQRIPKAQWIAAHNWLIQHGREYCLARNPRCQNCFLQELCSYS